MNTRIERDSMGEVAVPADRYWGAQTQRSLTNFEIGRDRHRLPGSIVRAFGLLKLAAARANAQLGELDGELARLIEAAAGEVADGALDDHFPLVVFQTGSGTQSNMNANEVIANRANELAGEPRGGKHPVHPNDHVNRGQSSNDTFPTVMHVAVVLDLHARLYPPVQALCDTLAVRARTFGDVVKSGRTHLMDATPITLGQEIGAWVAQIDAALGNMRQAEHGLLDLAIGGTAVGTLRTAMRGRARDAHRPPLPLRRQPFRAARRTRCTGECQRGVAYACRRAVQDGQRRTLACVRPAHRHR
jgi:fumarate hydratase, class II